MTKPRTAILLCFQMAYLKDACGDFSGLIMKKRQRVIRLKELPASAKKALAKQLKKITHKFFGTKNHRTVTVIVRCKNEKESSFVFVNSRFNYWSLRTAVTLLIRNRPARSGPVDKKLGQRLNITTSCLNSGIGRISDNLSY